MCGMAVHAACQFSINITLADSPILNGGSRRYRPKS